MLCTIISLNLRFSAGLLFSNAFLFTSVPYELSNDHMGSNHSTLMLCELFLSYLSLPKICSPPRFRAPSIQLVIVFGGLCVSLLQKLCDIRGADSEVGEGDVNAAMAAGRVKVVHEHYSRVGQREAAPRTVVQRGMMGFLVICCDVGWQMH